MKKSILIILLLIGGVGIGLAAIADLTGKWTGVAKAPDGNDYPLTYNFKAEGSKLTGTVETSLGVAPIEKGVINGNDFSFNIDLNGTDVAHKGKLYTDSIALDINYNGTPLHTTLKKASAQ